MDVRHLIENFQTHGALAGHDDFVIEGMNEGHAELLTPAHRLFTGFVIVRAVQDDLSAIGFGRGNLNERCGQRHHNLRADSVASGVVGDALRMIACRRGNNTVR